LSLLGIALMIFSPWVGAFAAIAGWRTGGRWLREEAEDGVAAGAGDEKMSGQEHAGPIAQAHDPTLSLWPPVAVLAPAVVAALMVAAGAASAFAPPVSLLAAALGWAFIYAACVDLRARLLPDWPSWFAGGVGLTMAWSAAAWPGVAFAAAGALSAGAGLALAALAMRWRMGREALGFGDIKLAAAGGLLLGPVAIWTAIGAAAAATVMWTLAMMALRPGARTAGAEIPFGPGLLAAIWLGWIAERAWVLAGL